MSAKAKSGKAKSTKTKRAKARSDRAPQFVSDEVPLYHQLATILRELILSGAYGPDDQLPTESALVGEYGVSRITVRQALKNLEKEGLLRREAGRGTFVTSDFHLPKTLHMNGSLDDLITMGLATSVKLLELTNVVATREDAADLGVPMGAPLVQCKRLRYHRKQPYSYIINRLPRALADQFEDHDWEKGAILQSLEQRLGLNLKDAEQQVRATLADASLARLLETPIGAPILSVDRVVRTDTGEAVEKVHTYYRGDIYSLTVHLTRDPEGSRPGEAWKLKSDSEAKE